MISKHSILITAISAALHACAVHALPLTTFSFTGAAGNEPSFAPDSPLDGMVVSHMVRGSGVSPSASAGAFSASGWTTSAAPDLNDYYSFSIMPQSGFTATLTRLELDERRSGTGILNWSIYSSLDGFSLPLASFAVPDDSDTRIDQGVNLDPSFAGLSDFVEFRIYGFSAEASSGTWRIDNVDLFGSANRVPDGEPFGITCLLAGITIIAMRRTYSRRATSVAAPPPSAV